MGAALMRAQRESRVTPAAWGNLHVWHCPRRTQTDPPATITDLGPDGRNARQTVEASKCDWQLLSGKFPRWQVDPSEHYVYNATTGLGDIKKTDHYHLFFVGNLPTGYSASVLIGKGDGNPTAGWSIAFIESTADFRPALQGGAADRVIVDFNPVSEHEISFLDVKYTGTADASGFTAWEEGTSLTPTTIQDNLSGVITNPEDGQLFRFKENGSFTYYYDGNLHFLALYADTTEPITSDEAHRLRRQIQRTFAVNL